MTVHLALGARMGNPPSSSWKLPRDKWLSPMTRSDIFLQQQWDFSVQRRHGLLTQRLWPDTRWWWCCGYYWLSLGLHTDRVRLTTHTRRDTSKHTNAIRLDRHAERVRLTSRHTNTYRDTSKHTIEIRLDHHAEKVRLTSRHPKCNPNLILRRSYAQEKRVK